MRTKFILAPLMAAAAMLLSGCLSIRSFVDPSLGDVPTTERVAPVNPQPVQLIFEFRTQGAANARATNLLREQITESVRGSRLFSEVSTNPVAGGALLSIVIDNIPQEGAASRGFATGLTLGLAGTTVSDYYVGTARYSRSGAAELNSEGRHALHSQIGNAAAPANMVQAETVEAGLRTVIRQLTDHLLFDIARQSGFDPAPATPATAPVT